LSKIKNLFRTEYYIYSHKHTKGNLCNFWGPNKSGYTIDLNMVGIYYEKDVIKDKQWYPLISSKEELLKKITLNYDTFFIKKQDIEKVLGKKRICVLK
jgi:hypothetical protein